MSSGFKAYAPASISNLGSGFDLLGLALEQPGDHVIAHHGEQPGVIVDQIRGFKEGISNEKNSAITAVETLLAHLGRNDSITLTIEKGYPHSSGLGSSAASAVAAVISANALLGKPIKNKRALFPFALAGERHLDKGLPADNVAASLLGGIVLSHPVESPVILPVPEGLVVTIVRPDIDIKTSANRASLPLQVPLSSAIAQTYSISSFILGLYRSDFDLIRRGLKDYIIEPVRSETIPNFAQIQASAMDEGALGCSISGSGPAIFAISNNSLTAENIQSAWRGLLPDDTDPRSSFISKINTTGAYLC
ncbi:MAG: homoserine kinase [Saprospiraceae bacterium]|nr:homoserine kinase [Saprospiraceae bacterium]